MAENGAGKPLIKPTHLIDAAIVAGIVFFSVLGADALMNLANGEAVFLTVDQVARRAITGGVAFGLTFLAQWGRYRGIKMRAALLPGGGRPPLDRSDEDD